MYDVKKLTVKKAKRLILKKAEEIRNTVDRSGFCEPDCEACLRSRAKGLVDKDYRIETSIGELISFGLGNEPVMESVTDKALEELAI